MILGNLVEQTHLASTARHHATFGAVGKTALLLEPLFEDFLHLSVTEELFEEDVNFQCLKLGLAQEGLGILLRVVEVKELAGELLIVLADRPSVSLVELPEELEEGEVERRALCFGCAFSRHCLRSLPTTPRADR
ncbi:hypothetical protein D3C78_995660 [compost metagenome]